MPELPEVETTVERLKCRFNDKKITVKSVKKCDPKFNDYPMDDYFLDKCIVGQEILDFRRRGKYILMRFEFGTVLIDLRESGRMRLFKHTSPNCKFSHMDFNLDNKWTLRLSIPKRTGGIHWIDSKIGTLNVLVDSDFDLQVDPGLKKLVKLGAEPLDERFDGDYFQCACKGRTGSGRIDNLLLGGKIVAGIGNIYVSEILFHAGINPLSKANKFFGQDLRNFVESIKHILNAAIKVGGSSLGDNFSFVDLCGNEGKFKSQFKVYGRDGEDCFRCGSEIEKIKNRNSWTFFCSNTKCQKLID